MLAMSPWAPRMFVALGVAAFCAVGVLRINGSDIPKDASHNVLMAVNLQHHGVMSMDWNAPYRPSMYREPLPVMANAGAIAVLDSFMGKAEPAQYLSGDRARYLKYQNIIWLGVLWLVAFVAAQRLTGSFYLSLAAAIVSAVPFVNEPDVTGVNNLYTELPATALLVLGSLLLGAGANAGRSAALFIASGLCFGLLTLTKAAFLYVSLGLFAVLALASILNSQPLPRRTRLLQSVAFAASVAVLVVPWMYRNLSELGFLRISDRGGMALYSRAVIDGMTDEEYRGAYYAWSSPRFRALSASLSGYGPQDLERGGRLQRFNDSLRSSFAKDDLMAEAAGRPEAAISFYRQARAKRVKLESEFEAGNHAYPVSAADNALQALGMDMIKNDLSSHLRLIVPLIWRSAPLTFPVLLIAAVYALATKRYALGLFVLPSLGALSLFALTINFIPRFANVARPAAVVAAFVMLHAVMMATGLGKKFSRMASPRGFEPRSRP